MGFYLNENRSNNLLLLRLVLIITIFLVAGPGVSGHKNCGCQEGLCDKSIEDIPDNLSLISLITSPPSLGIGDGECKNVSDCPIDMCCSPAGYCGMGPDYCGDGHCNCAPGLCCSIYDFCGTGYPYCAPLNCKEGPCWPEPPSNNGSVADYVTDEFFNDIINQAADDCEGKGFYTRDAFLDALKSYKNFSTVGSIDNSKREIAAFFAHVTHETENMCFIKEKDKSNDYCDPSKKEYPCVPGQAYYGRGPLQLSWNYNYGPAGDDIGFDGLGNPDIVATNNIISFKTALWYWMNYCHDLIVFEQGFGDTIRAINGPLECDEKNPDAVSARVGYYIKYCNQLDVSPGGKLRC